MDFVRRDGRLDTDRAAYHPPPRGNQPVQFDYTRLNEGIQGMVAGTKERVPPVAGKQKWICFVTVCMLVNKKKSTNQVEVSKSILSSLSPDV